jgi:Kef-type K+ transport system membrane component KefB
LEFAIILGIAALGGILGKFLKQPLIVMFIVVGILVGPSGFNLLESKDQFYLLAEMGIAILLFIVGLKLDIKLIKTMGVISLLTGLGQVIFTSVVGYFIGLSFGFGNIESLYIAVALTFSSTIIIVKLLSDKKELDTLHGKIAIGFLIVQDLVVILMMIVLTAIGRESDGNALFDFLKILLSGLLLLVVIAFLMRFVFPKLVEWLASSSELLVLFSICWAIILSALGDYLGFSKEVGAFLAGISLASTPYRETLSARLTSLRDFLLLFFFIYLGSQLNMAILGAKVKEALVFSLFVLLGNPLIVMLIMGRMGYRKRTGFLAGLTVAQISEFSLIFASLGLSLGHINLEIMGLITLVGLVTIGLSTYMIIYSQQLYEKLAPFLSFFERGNARRKDDKLHNKRIEEYDIYLFGGGRFGKYLLQELNKSLHKVLVIDFDPFKVRKLKSEGVACMYGNLEDPELPNMLNIDSDKMIISSVTDIKSNLTLIGIFRKSGFKGKLVVTTLFDYHEEYLLESGADQVIQPFKDASVGIESKLRIQN